MAENDLLGALLKSVSRAFYTSLNVLPRDLRPPIGLGYLFCRAADSICDTHLLPASERLGKLKIFQEEFRKRHFDYAAIKTLGESFTAQQNHPSERALLSRLPDCFHLLESLPVTDQALVREVVVGVTQGMEMDLESFPGNTEKDLKAFQKIEDINLYCFLVAGQPGSFWTRLCLDHGRFSEKQDPRLLNHLGVKLGKALQLTNILRDIAQDLRIGRCYIPTELLKDTGLAPKDLLSPSSWPRLWPLYRDLVKHALVLTDAGLNYVKRIPRKEWRLRLACFWPLLMAVATLKAAFQAGPGLLDPNIRKKITRSEVTLILLVSAVLCWTNSGLSALYAFYQNRLNKVLSA